MNMPVNFLYLGGDKCGSTWLHHVLSKHPDVTLARAKELFYFDRFYDKGPDWYMRQFPKEALSIRTGEICHDYLYSEDALRRIARDLPDDSRFLITTRNPVDRAFSHYRYLRKIGTTKLPFEEVIHELPQLVEHSLFGKYVSLAQQHLGTERVHVLSFEDLKTDPVAFGKAVSKALGVRFVPSLPYADRILEAQEARNSSVVRVLRNTGWVFRSLGAPQVVSAVKSNPLVSKILFAPSGNSGVGITLDDVTRKVLEARFAPDQALLQSSLERFQVSA